MKKHIHILFGIIIVFCFAGVNIQSFGQNYNNDCTSFVYLCEDTVVKFVPNGKGNVVDVPPSGSFGNPGTRYDPWPEVGGSTHRGCLLAGETVSNWFIIPVQTDGTLEWIVGADSTQYGYYDWIMWKMNGFICKDIADGVVAPERCNFNAADWGGTGVVASTPPGGYSHNYESAVNVKAGDLYVICINNYDSVNAEVKFKFGGTAVRGFVKPPDLEITGNKEICKKEPSTITVTGGGGSTLYYWSTGETTQSITVNPVVTTEYYLKSVTDICGKIESYDTVTIQVNPLPYPSFEMFPLQPPYTITTNIRFNDISTTPLGSIVSWYWDFADGTVSFSKDPMHTFVDTGTYLVKMYSTNSFGCADTVTRLIEIQADFNIYIPTAFTPNSDGLNDEMEIFGYGIVEFNMIVFNKWGEEIFATNDHENFWNGRKNNIGKLSPNGVYVYTGNYTTYDGIQRYLNGFIFISR